MAIVINGSGTVTGISVGGLPDGIVDAGTLATNSVDSAELIDGAVDNSHIDALAASKLTGALPALDGASLTNLPGGGKILQVVGYSRSDPEYTISTTSFVGMWEQDITPVAAGSKILIITHINQVLEAATNGDPMSVRLELDSSPVHVFKYISHKNNTTVPYIHSPTYTLNDTLTYRTAGRTTGGGGTSYIDHHGTYGFTILEIGA